MEYFDAHKRFYDGVDKLMKIKRYLRKKGFRFTDLVKFLKRNKMSEEDERR